MTKTTALDTDSRVLMTRIWREEMRQHVGRIISVIILTVLMAGLTALYPAVIKRAVDMFAAHDSRILYQIPALVVIVTGLKAASQYGQTIAVQGLVLAVIRGLQSRMFAHALQADVSTIEKTHLPNGQPVLLRTPFRSAKP